MNNEMLLIIIITVSIALVLVAVFSTSLYRRMVKRELIQLSEALEAHIDGNPVQVFSEIEDNLLSKIQKQLLSLEDLWTERYAFEKEEKERLNSLISDISHQIKTPLANIRLYESLLNSDELSKEERCDFGEKKLQQINKLEWLIESLVKVSKMETGTIQLNKKQVALSKVLLRAVDMVTLKAEQKNINLVYKLSKDIDLDLDEKWMAEAVFNILDNAAKYSENGSEVKVSVEVMQLFVRIDIEDEAHLIDKGEYNNIFKRFYRISNTANAEGVGIGLYMSRDIVTRHDGYITVGEGEKGNRFSVFLMI